MAGRRTVKLSLSSHSSRDKLDVATIKLDELKLPEIVFDRFKSHCSIITKNKPFKTGLNHDYFM